MTDSPELLFPGEIVAQKLAQAGKTYLDLAREKEIPRSQVWAIVNLDARIGPVVAQRLSEYLGMTPEFYLNLQSDYEQKRAGRNQSPV